MVTDQATFAWICDVFVAPAHRGQGLGQRLIRAIIDHPDLATVTMYLGTRDAHGLYERFGFTNRQLMRRPKGGPPDRTLENP